MPCGVNRHGRRWGLRTDTSAVQWTENRVRSWPSARSSVTVGSGGVGLRGPLAAVLTVEAQCRRLSGFAWRLSSRPRREAVASVWGASCAPVSAEAGTDRALKFPEIAGISRKKKERKMPASRPSCSCGKGRPCSFSGA